MSNDVPQGPLYEITYLYHKLSQSMSEKVFAWV